MAAPWEYCCRLGTHDPRGNNARKHVAGNKKHCHGTNKRKNQRRWSQCKSHEDLDAFCVEQVHGGLLRTTSAARAQGSRSSQDFSDSDRETWPKHCVCPSPIA